MAASPYLIEENDIRNIDKRDGPVRHGMDLQRLLRFYRLKFMLNCPRDGLSNELYANADCNVWKEPKTKCTMKDSRSSCDLSENMELTPHTYVQLFSKLKHGAATQNSTSQKKRTLSKLNR